jgi:hypothetical protein
MTKAHSTPPRIACEPGLVTDHDRPEPDPKSTAAEHPRIVGLVHEHHRPKRAQTSIVTSLCRVQLPRIEGRTEPPAPEPALSFDGQLDLRGVSKVRADARSPLAVIAVVLIVLFIVAGVVLVARGGDTRGAEPRREDLGRCTERIQRTEVIERTCARDGS